MLSANFFQVEKVGHGNDVNRNHTNLILNRNQKYSDYIHVDPNHTDWIQPIQADSTNIGSIHDSANTCAIEKILASPVHSTVPASPIISYGSASDPLSSLYGSSSESVTPK